MGGLGHSQLDDDGAGFDLVHFHEGETFCAREPLLGLVVLEFEEDGCPCGGWGVGERRHDSAYFIRYVTGRRSERTHCLETIKKKVASVRGISALTAQQLQP